MQKLYAQKSEEQHLPRKETLAFIANYSLQVSLLSLQLKTINKQLDNTESWQVS